jgi:hypothetical protein
MKYDIYDLDTIGLQRHANLAFMEILTGLRKEGYLTEEQMGQIAETYSVVIENKKWLPPWLGRFLGYKEDTMRYRLVKFIGRQEWEIS